MKHLLLRHKRWLTVLIILLGLNVGSQAANVNDLKVLGQTATAVAGQDYYVFTTSQGEARWYPTQKILELENVLLSNTGNESFVEYTGTDQLYIFLIGTNTFSTNQAGQAKPAIKAGGALSISSKDYSHRGTLNIYTYGFAQSYGGAAVLLTGYSESRSRLNISRCNVKTYCRGGNQAQDHYFFTAAGGSYSGQMNVEDAKLDLQSKGLPLLGNARVNLSCKDCVRNSDVTVENGKFVKENGSNVTSVTIDYPLYFSTHEGERSTSYLVHRETFDTDGGVVFDEDNHVLEFHGGNFQGSIKYYGREPLTVKTFGTELTTLQGDEGYGIVTMFTSLNFEGDRVNNHQGLKLTHTANHTCEAVRVPLGQQLNFAHNACLTIDGYTYGLVGCDKIYDYTGNTSYCPYTENCPVFSASNSTLHINASHVAVYGFNGYELEGCKIIPEDLQITGVWIDETYYDDEIYNLEYCYYQNAFASVTDGEALKQVDVVRYDNFGITIAGRPITVDNLYDLNFKDDKNEVRGVSFDEENYRLTLDNAYIHTTEHGVAGIDVQSGNMDILLVGESVIEADNYIGIYTHYTDIGVIGNNQLESRLRVHGQSHGIMVENDKTIIIHSCTVDITSSEGSAFCGRYVPGYVDFRRASLWIYDGASVRLYAEQGPTTQYMGRVLNHDNLVLSPYGAYFDEELKGIALNGQLVTGEILIGQNMWFVDPEVERVCVENFDTNGDGGISFFEAAAVTTLGNAFTGNTDIKHFPELRCFLGLQTINNDAFYNCEGLTDVRLPSQITTLGKNSFRNTGLNSIIIPKSVSEVDSEVFFECTKLYSVTFEEGIELDHIGWNMFAYCYELNYIDLPPSIESIRDRAFCWSGLEGYSYGDKITYIGGEAFAYTGMWLDIPSTVEEIGDYAFACCYSESFTLPKSVKKVGRAALTGIGDLYIPEDSQLEEVLDGAFAGSWYTYLRLPASLAIIGENAFSRGTPEMDSEEDESYYAYIDVKRRQPADLGANAFGRLSENSSIFVPVGCSSTYKRAWPEYKQYIVGDEIPTAITPTAITPTAITQQPSSIYNMRGQLVRRNATNTDGLPAGIYVVNGKKVVVK